MRRIGQCLGGTFNHISRTAPQPPAAPPKASALNLTLSPIQIFTLPQTNNFTRQLACRSLLLFLKVP
jgi:hypothetical protein